MCGKNFSFARAFGCCGCFGYTTKPKRSRFLFSSNSQDLLLDPEIEEGEGSYNDDTTSTSRVGEVEALSRAKCSEEILRSRLNNGLICRQFIVKETNKIFRSEDENGNKMVNEYVRQHKIGSGSYGKVVLYQNSVDGKHYAMKLRVAPSETAMNDVLCSNHENAGASQYSNLFEVIDDPTTDQFYMGSGPPEAIGEDTARKYLRDINIVHGDIKPDNLLITSTGTVKIGDFSVSQVFEDDNDELRRSPGTPVFTAPECCIGSTYHGKAADTWAVGVTLYFMVMGNIHFLVKHYKIRMTRPKTKDDLGCCSKAFRVTAKEGPTPEYLCWCKRNKLQGGAM
ncbi:hypothetical protein GQ457_18G005110 [Hibiscus cannabinus]